eukprot:Sspe_Gene.10566::Locus_3539_Transcript_1_5_Confidence_0.286_Length_1924::g.10566::m.10566/K08656/DPP9; dipeptidyl-peptidase 9
MHPSSPFQWQSAVPTSAPPNARLPPSAITVPYTQPGQPAPHPLSFQVPNVDNSMYPGAQARRQDRPLHARQQPRRHDGGSNSSSTVATPTSSNSPSAPPAPLGLQPSSQHQQQQQPPPPSQSQPTSSPPPDSPSTPVNSPVTSAGDVAIKGRTRPSMESLQARIKAAFNMRMGNSRPLDMAFDTRHRRLYWLQQQSTGRCSLFSCDVSPLYDYLDQRKVNKSQTIFLHPTTLPTPSTSATTGKELALGQRKRVGSYSMVDFVSCFEHDAILIPGDCTVYLFKTSSNKMYDVLRNSSVSQGGAVCDPKLCPTDSTFLSFIHKNNIYICDITQLNSAHEMNAAGLNTTPVPVYQLTKAGGPFRLCGVPEYIMQEEFKRYTGYWWCPIERIPGRFEILYIYTDERHVNKVMISSTDPESQSADEFAWPRPGEIGSMTSLCILSFDKKSPDEVSYRHLPRDFLLSHIPWMEYITKAGWTPDGNIYIEVLDRLQERVALLVVPYEHFAPADNEEAALPPAITKEQLQAYTTPTSSLPLPALGIENRSMSEPSDHGVDLDQSGDLPDSQPSPPLAPNSTAPPPPPVPHPYQFPYNFPYPVPPGGPWGYPLPMMMVPYYMDPSGYFPPPPHHHHHHHH